MQDEPPAEEGVDSRDLNESQTGEKEAKLLLLSRLAHELGHVGRPPGSIAELVEGVRMLNMADSWKEAINRAHSIGILSDSISNHTVDVFRALIESTRAPRDVPFFDVVSEEDETFRVGDISALDQWDDLEILLGIDRQTTPQSIDEIERGNSSKDSGSQIYAPKVKGGMVMFQTQGFGDWGRGSSW